MIIRNSQIPRDKFQQWHEILCATGGRYISNPRDCGYVIRVDYIPGDHQSEVEAFERCRTQIREVRRDQLWRRILRRIRVAIVARLL